MDTLLRITEHTAKVIVRDEEELARHARRLHAHMGILCTGVLVISWMVTSEVSELTIFVVTWLLAGCQEFADYLGMM